MSTFELLSDAELQSMLDRAWREASRCWSEYQKARGSEIDEMLLGTAKSASAFFDAVLAESRRRDEAAGMARLETPG